MNADRAPLTAAPERLAAVPPSPRQAAPLLRQRGTTGTAGAASIGLAALAVLLSTLALALPMLGGTRFIELVDQNLVTSVAVGASFPIVGAIVLVRDSGNLLGWVFITAGELQALATFGAQYATHAQLPGAGVAAFVAAYAWYPGMMLLLTLTAPLFPTGRPASRRWRVLCFAGVIVSIASFSIVLTDEPMLNGFPAFRDPFALGTGLQPVLDTAGNILLLCAAACALVGIAGIVVRLVRSNGAQRRSSVWFVSAFLIGVIAQLLQPVSPIFPTVAWVLVPAAWGVAMTRHGLFEGDRLLNRTLVYSALTLVVGAIFGLAVGLAGSYLGGAQAGAVVAAIAIAFAIDPIRRFAQRVIERLLYGKRRDPFAAIEALGVRLSDTFAPQDVPDAIVSTVVDALLLPFASLTLEGEDVPAATAGAVSGNAVELLLEYGGDPVGILQIGLRAGQRFLDPSDERLLNEIAREAGAAVDGVRRERELARSRAALAMARETERDRIRRDLHDGLGPALAGVALGLGAAHKAIAPLAPETAKLLTQLQAEVRDSLRDVKALVADLRPLPLETGGLAASIERYAAVLVERSLGRLTIAASVDVSPLPEDVETALYRIVLESLTNVTRHASASSCMIDIHEANGVVFLSVTDNGIGMPVAAGAVSLDSSSAGIGLRSMVERARELGGELTVTSVPDAGTSVRARLPSSRERAAR
ncbi:sensor histidine kinase [Rathayibacter soli]|uniref:sensor histidine kinase n=1 Tax=Rathayibacter soli TaxID=3144168 RepID=UPI0027E50A3F|nr:sensor histidine kinase [Glaciibacter superstes]